MQRHPTTGVGSGVGWGSPRARGQGWAGLAASVGAAEQGADSGKPRPREAVVGAQEAPGQEGGAPAALAAPRAGGGGRNWPRQEMNGGDPQTGGAGEVALPGPPRAPVLTHLRDVMFLLRGLGWAADPLPRPQAPRGPVSSARERTGRPSSRPRADDLPSPLQASRPRGSRTRLQPPPAGPLRRAPLRLLLLLLLPALLRRRRRLMTPSTRATRREATHGGATSGFRETAPHRTAPRALSPGNGGSEALTATPLPASGKDGARGAFGKIS